MDTATKEDIMEWARTTRKVTGKSRKGTLLVSCSLPRRYAVTDGRLAAHDPHPETIAESPRLAKAFYTIYVK